MAHSRELVCLETASEEIEALLEALKYDYCIEMKRFLFRESLEEWARENAPGILQQLKRKKCRVYVVLDCHE
jgi:hypothetical protein